MRNSGLKPPEAGFITVMSERKEFAKALINTNGNLENGDYLCSSSIAGYGERQEDDLLHSYTVAKVTMDLDWAELPVWVQTRKVTASGKVSETGKHTAAFVGVTYHCG